MTAYAPSDVRTISLGAGCGQAHTAADGQRLVVECETCAPLLVAQKSLGWATNPADVALTPDERHQIEIDRQGAERAQALAMQVFGAQLAAMSRGGMLSDPRLPGPIAVPPPDLDGLSDEEFEQMEQAVARARAARLSGADPTAKPKRPRKAA